MIFLINIFYFISLSCNNCGKKSYYDKFVPNKEKDYSIFFRNFTYCLDCGLNLFYQSLCGKCEKSVKINFNYNLFKYKIK